MQPIGQVDSAAQQPTIQIVGDEEVEVALMGEDALTAVVNSKDAGGLEEANDIRLGRVNERCGCSQSPGAIHLRNKLVKAAYG